ncbi:MAG TPA: hypothetical protein VMU68_03955 [Acidimicrobiales bacterium]|nr:hypothetical protein [Acidimicrobiales bacterium]
MLLIILALFWLALLAPVAIRKLRDSGAERSIQSFHAEHEVLSRQEYAVNPAHRLDQPDHSESGPNGSARRSRLTVVHADDTYRSLESRSSWDEWSVDYEYDEPVERGSRNRYVAAYSSVPDEASVGRGYEQPIRRRSMKSRRQMMFVRLLLTAVVLTVLAFTVSFGLIMDLAVVSWVCVVSYVALALYAVSQGYLNESSLPLRLPQPRRLASVQRIYDAVSPRYEDEYESEYEVDDDDDGWQRQSRRALG